MSAIELSVLMVYGVARDAERKPADMLTFAQIKPGQTVIDYIPGKTDQFVLRLKKPGM